MLPYLLVIVAALSAAGAWTVQEWRHGALDRARLEQAREDRAMREKTIDTAAERHEKDKAEIRTEFITITERVTHVVKEPFYAAADAPECLDDAGLRELTQAIRGPAAAASQPAPAVPRPRRPSWWKSGSHAHLVD